jgi:outer membrane protein OmpU
MTNIKKIGLTALAGSLVAVSATAGEIAVSGSANVTYVTGKSATAGKSIGTDKDVAFTGSGELDNGYTFTVSTLLTDAMAVSSSYTSITMGSLGTVSFGADTGGAAYKYDEEVPQAYEQTSDGQQNSANIVGNMNDSNMIVYNSPSFDLGGVSASFDLEYSPNASSTSSPANDGGSATVNSASTDNTDNYGDAKGLGITLAYDALKVGAYAAEIERTANAGNAVSNDAFEGVWYATYSMGPVSVGYSESHLDSALPIAATAATAAKSVRGAGGLYDSKSMSIAFNVNENLSVSYTSTDDEYDAQSGIATGAAEIADVEMSTDAIQIAYSMGAMSIKAYQMDTDNPGYDSNAASTTDTEIAVGLAF